MTNASHDHERPFSHSALTIQNYGEMTEHDRELRRKFIARAYSLYGQDQDRRFVVALSDAMEVATDVARARRYAQYLGNMVLQGMSVGQGSPDQANHHLAHVGTGDMLPHLRSFYDISLDRLTAGVPSKQSPEYLAMPKPEMGISAELGHVDLYGEWSAAARLDAVVRDLAADKRLGKVGLRVARLYPTGNSGTNYAFTWAPADVDAGVDNNFPMLIGVRKRPVADIVSDEFPNLPIEISKRSSFLIVPQLLETAQVNAALAALEDRADLSAAQKADRVKEAGKVIEAALQPGQRDKQLAVSPVSSLYFARMRMKRSKPDLE